MRKKVFILTPVVLLFLVLTIFLFAIIKKKKEKNDSRENLPEFILPNIYNGIVNSLCIEDKPSLFVFFDPGCDMCVDEINQIYCHLDSFKDSQIFLITDVSSEILRQFLKEKHFTPIKNTHFLIDQKHELIFKMDVRIIPSSYIYNKNRVLIKSFKGPVKADLLIKYLSECSEY
jgi:peroxiredoxin